MYYDKKRSSEIAGLPAYLITPGAMQTSGFEKNIQDFWNNVNTRRTLKNGFLPSKFPSGMLWG
ncbi:MAG: hypothetical protein MJ194_07770, partial [Clostridia bacterium]|nr:hypothetical protein [Clostridia bacterium]